MTSRGESEEKMVAAGRGKWSQLGVPHKGWVCVDVEDLGAPNLTCEMCESQSVRFVHHMEHPGYGDVLQVGCVCAGNMEGDVIAARAREGAMQSRAGKRRRWLARNWKTSGKGNPWIKADGYRVTVYPRGAGWAATIAAVSDESDVRHSRRNYVDQNAAKLAAFDQVTGLISDR